MTSSYTIKCMHANNRNIYLYKDAALNRCNECQLIFSNKIILKTNPKELYQDFYKNEIPGRFNFGIEYIIRLFRLFRALKIYTIYPKAKSILDIGSGRGYVLYYLRKYFRYHRTTGTQISQAAYNFSRYKLGLEIYDRDLLDLGLGKKQYDIITMWHILEHIQDPEEYIFKIKELLRNHGRLAIEVPNYSSWTRRITGQYWLGLDLQHHLYFFTPQSLCSLLKKFGFRIKLIHTFSFEYSTFISTQSIVSWITRSNQVLFQWLQGNKKNFKKIIFHILLFIILFPICALVNLLFFLSQEGEVLLIIAEKKDNT